MLLFNFFGPEILIVILAIVVPIIIIILIIKFIGSLLRKKNNQPTNISINNQHQAKSSVDKISQLERLGSLKEKGLLSESEFQKEKDKLFRN